MNDEVYVQIIDSIRKESVNFGECTVSIVYRNHHIQKYSITSTKSTLINNITREEPSHKKNGF